MRPALRSTVRHSEKVSPSSAGKKLAVIFGSASDGIEYAFDILNGRLNFIVHNNIVVFRNVFKFRSCLFKPSGNRFGESPSLCPQAACAAPPVKGAQ